MLLQTSAVPDQASHLKELLRKHKIGELSASEADALAGKILAQPANKPGNPTGSNQYQKKEELDNLTNSTQKARAKENGVHRKTQEKLDRLARDRPDLLERVCAGELKVHTAKLSTESVDK